MVGFCATVDVSSPVLTALTPHLSFFDSESIYEFDFGRVTAACVVHDESSVHYIQSPSADILLYGKVHTFRDGDSHTQISNANVDSILLSLFKQDGPSFVSRLNGEFAGVIEYSNGETLVFTDRLSTQPIFVTSLNSGIVLSTNLPALTSGLDREFTWAETGLIEYLTFNRVYGTETPVSEIDQIPPAAIRSIKKSGKIHDEIYWKPLYTPKDWNTDSLVRTLADLISTILSERLSKKHSYGLLLSGGSDSRLFLSQANEHDITAYTMGDWWNREVDLAHRAAEIADVPFIFLRRDDEYQKRVLKKSPAMCNFVSQFNQAHALGFADRLTNNVDFLINGMFADTLFKGHFFPVPTFNTPVGEFNPPFEKQFNNLSEYVSYLGSTTVPEYIQTDTPFSELLNSMYRSHGEKVDSHGIEYQDLQHMITTGAYYPLTNQKDILLYESLNHIAPTITPFLDNRLIDLHLTIPASMQLRGGLINQALTHLSTELGALPHSGTNVSPDKSFPYHFVGYNLTRLRRNVWPVSGKRHFSNDPWPNHAELIREHDFILDSLIEHNDLIERNRILDLRQIHKQYDNHLLGENHWNELYSLVTVLNMPGLDNIE